MRRWTFGLTTTMWSWGFGPQVEYNRDDGFAFCFSIGPWFLYARRNR